MAGVLNKDSEKDLPIIYVTVRDMRDKYINTYIAAAPLTEESSRKIENMVRRMFTEEVKIDMQTGMIDMLDLAVFNHAGCIL